MTTRKHIKNYQSCHYSLSNYRIKRCIVSSMMAMAGEFWSVKREKTRYKFI